MSTHNICFLWRTGENYPRIITKYSTLTSPLNTFSLKKKNAFSGAVYKEYDEQHTKRALMQYADNMGPDQCVHLYCLIRAFSVHRHILQYQFIL